METRTQSYLIQKNQTRLINLFGYTSKSVPGLEIHGLGRQGVLVREKLLYLTRKHRFPLPCLRFSISVETPYLSPSRDWEVMAPLEFPLLLLFWTLSHNLKLTKPEQCLSAAVLAPDGTVTFGPKPQVSDKIRGLTLIHPYPGEQKSIDPRQLFAHASGIKFKGHLALKKARAG